MITDDELRKILRGEINAAKSARQWALSKGLSPAYVSDTLTGKRSPGKKIAGVLGYKKAERIWTDTKPLKGVLKEKDIPYEKYRAKRIKQRKPK